MPGPPPEMHRPERVAADGHIDVLSHTRDGAYRCSHSGWLQEVQEFLDDGGKRCWMRADDVLSHEAESDGRE